MFHSIVIVGCVFLSVTIATPDCSQRPKKEDIMGCCKKPLVLRDIGGKCSEKFPFNGEMNFCHAECVLNATGLLVNGEIQSANADTIITDMLTDFPDFLAIAKAGFAKCDETAKNQLPQVLEKKLEGADKCHPISGLLISCFFVDMFINCPTSAWDNKEICNETKEYMKTCPQMPK